MTTTRKERINNWTGVLRLAHFTVKEYLISDRARRSAAAQYSFDHKLANTFIARTCVAYLLQFDKPGFVVETTIRDFPLARYASEFWTLHARSVDDADSNGLQQAIMDLLEP